MASATTQQAEKYLIDTFESIGMTQYIHAFRTRRGRQLAFERDREGMIGVWTEQCDDRPLELPSPEAYAAGRSRNSNLEANAKRLSKSRPAYYWRLSGATELRQLSAWYAAV